MLDPVGNRWILMVVMQLRKQVCIHWCHSGPGDWHRGECVDLQHTCPGVRQRESYLGHHRRGLLMSSVSCGPFRAVCVWVGEWVSSEWGSAMVMHADPQRSTNDRCHAPCPSLNTPTRDLSCLIFINCKSYWSWLWEQYKSWVALIYLGSTYFSVMQSSGN